MATISQSRRFLFWARLVYIRNHMVGYGPWNGDPGSNGYNINLAAPVSFGVGNILSEPLYATATGNGDAGMYLFTGGQGAPFLGYTSDVLEAGFYPGWPRPDGQGDLLDVTTRKGSCRWNGYPDSLPDPATLSFPTVPGSIQTETGWTGGKFYFEAYANGLDLFSRNFGIGFQRKGGADAGAALSGGFNSGDPNGGVIASCGGTTGSAGYPIQVYASGNFAQTTAGNFPDLGNLLVPNTPMAGDYSGIGVAVAMLTDTNFVPSIISPTGLPALPCCSFAGRVF